MKKSIFRIAFRDSIPVLTGYMVLGIGFGILMQTKGYGVGWSALCSIFIFAGSMQYVLADLLTAGASLLTVALTTLMVNARHLFYGISMIDRYKHTGKRKLYLIFGLTDETYSLVVHDSEEVPEDKRRTYWLLVTLLDHSYWVLGSILGGLAGALIPTQYTTGVDFSLTALFITIFTDQWLKTKNHFAAIVGVAASVLCLLIFGSSNFLIPSMALIAGGLITGRRFTGEVKNHE